MNKIISIFNKPTEWNISELHKPWEKGRISIYQFIKEHTNSGKEKLSDQESCLPDDEIFYKDDQLHWSGGALDGAFGHHAQAGKQEKAAKKMLTLLKKLVKNPNEENVSRFYESILSDNALDFIDPFLQSIIHSEDIEPNKVIELAKWLVTESPDRGAIKVGIAILGASVIEGNTDIFVTLGLHEEFTLYSAVALTNSSYNSEKDLWDLAKKVDGWGKIQIVERMAGTQDSEIKQWMLREGYKNEVMYEYLAYTCAVAGDLLSELKQGRPDNELLISTGEIIEALIQGGPAEDIDDYPDEAEVIKLYISYASDSELNFREFEIVKTIFDFLNSDSSWEARKAKGWTKEDLSTTIEKANLILKNPEWKKRVISVLEDNSPEIENLSFYTVRSVAESLGIDTWKHSYKRQASGESDEWYFLMQTDDPSRIDKVVSLAEKLIPLEEVATGAADEMGMTSEYKHHSALDFIVQDLRRFPCKGWDLVKASLKSPVIRNRNMSLKALEEWKQEDWPDDAKNALEEALSNEPNKDVKAYISELLND